MPLARHAQLLPGPAASCLACSATARSCPLLPGMLSYCPVLPHRRHQVEPSAMGTDVPCTLSVRSQARSSSAPVSGPAVPPQICQRALLPGLLQVLIPRASRIVWCHSSLASGSPKRSLLPLTTSLKPTSSARPVHCSPCYMCL